MRLPYTFFNDTATTEIYTEAESILRQSSWVDPATRRAAYNEQGWARFDDTLPPYDAAEVEKERLRNLR